VRPASVLSIIVPPRCVACGTPADPDRILCRPCEAALAAARAGSAQLQLAPGNPPLTIHWASEYSGVARKLIRALKFAKHQAAAHAIADKISRDYAFGGAVLVPVPAAPARRRRRGFDPAEEIAVALARETGLALNNCLRRKDGPRQLGRGRDLRLADPPRVRLASDPPSAAVLVDDVFTTGATLAACGGALGRSVVGACVFARAVGASSAAA
jgi:predicted amidophosphoribosyltransferase